MFLSALPLGLWTLSVRPFEENVASHEQGLLRPVHLRFLWPEPAGSPGYRVLATLGHTRGFGEG